MLVSAMLKANLMATARYFGLSDMGNVAMLPSHLNTYLRNNRDELQNDPNFAALYPRRNQRQGQQVAPQQPPPLAPQPPPPPPPPPPPQQQQQQQPAHQNAPNHEPDDDVDSWHGIQDNDQPMHQDPNNFTPRDAQMIPNVHVAPPPAITVARTTRKRPFRRPGATDIGASYLVPKAIRKKFSEGFWSTHIPLTFLTDRYCAHGSTPKSLKDFYNLDPTSGQIFSIDKPLSTDGEDSLTFDEWFQAWSRLLGLIKEFLEEEYDLWKIHYKRILYKENCAEQWTLFLAYNIEIRLRATQKEIDPSIFHIAIWNDLELRLTSGRLAAAIKQKLIEKFSSGSSGSSTR
ncbi:hypothetical protein DXG01_009101 [Tephrocybe rancida]|nr:hypothetical protein DXG01_009101 [Tephrocybe rancida]